MNWVSIGSDNGLSTIWCQAIILINAGLLSIVLFGDFSEIIFFEYKTYIHENASENIVSEMAALSIG